MLRITDSWASTDTGRQRRVNEDSFFARAPLFAVADGMGGAQAGEVASSVAVGVLEPGLPDAGGSAEERLAGLVKEANAQIHELSRSDDDRAGMGTTMTAAYLTEHDLAVAHVGDSRLYCLRGDELTRLTRDHSLVEELVQEGKLTPEQADEHPQRSIITRALGPEHDVLVDHLTWQARPGDVYLICSDGLTSMVAEAKVGELLRGARSLREAGHALIDAANAAGGRDNITVVLFAIGEVGSAHPSDAPAAEDRTMVGADAPRAADVRSALATQERTATRTPPRARAGEGGTAAAGPRAPRPPRDPQRKRGRLGRWFGTTKGLTIILLAVTPFVLGTWIAVRSVYFVGTTDSGFVGLYQGLPYELPGGIALYSETYVSGVPAAGLPASVRSTVADHELRSNADAKDLLRRIERGELEAQRP